MDRELILGRLAHDPHVADRSSLAHLTTSAWTVDAAGERVLLCYHNIYDSWSWVGGHADGELDLAAVAAAELAEETGVTAPASWTRVRAASPRSRCSRWTAT